MELLHRTCATLRTLKAMAEGKLPEAGRKEKLEGNEAAWAKRHPESLPVKMVERVREAWGRMPPPPGRPVGRAALERLMGTAQSVSASPASLEKPENRKGPASHFGAVVPVKGERWPGGSVPPTAERQRGYHG